MDLVRDIEGGGIWLCNGAVRAALLILMYNTIIDLREIGTHP